MRNMALDRLSLSVERDIKKTAQNLADDRYDGNVSRLFSRLIKSESERKAEQLRLSEMLEEGYNSPVIEVEAREFFNSLRERANQNANK